MTSARDRDHGTAAVLIHIPSLQLGEVSNYAPRTRLAVRTIKRSTLDPGICQLTCARPSAASTSHAGLGGDTSSTTKGLGLRMHPSAAQVDFSAEPSLLHISRRADGGGVAASQALCVYLQCTRLHGCALLLAVLQPPTPKASERRRPIRQSTRVPATKGVAFIKISSSY